MNGMLTSFKRLKASDLPVRHYNTLVMSIFGKGIYVPLNKQRIGYRLELERGMMGKLMSLDDMLDSLSGRLTGYELFDIFSCLLNSVPDVNRHDSFCVMNVVIMKAREGWYQ